MINYFLSIFQTLISKSGVSSHRIVKGYLIADGGTQSLMRELKVNFKVFRGHSQAHSFAQRRGPIGMHFEFASFPVRGNYTTDRFCVRKLT